MLGRILSWLQRFRRIFQPEGQQRKLTPAIRDSRLEFASQEPGIVLSIVIHEPPGEIIIRPEPRMIIGRGRKDVNFPDMKTDVDLGPFGALDAGVSLLHAAITHIETTIYIQDLNSTHGTFLNGQPLFPGSAYALSDGDRLHFGGLETRIRLQRDRATYERLGHYRRSVILNQLHSQSTWSTNYRTWLAILLVAFDYGWRPAIWPLPLGTPMPAEDALMLAQALERALPGFPGAAPRAFVGILKPDTFLKPPLGPPLQYLGGQSGKQKVMELIAFCRRSQFTIG